MVFISIRPSGELFSFNELLSLAALATDLKTGFVGILASLFRFGAGCFDVSGGSLETCLGRRLCALFTLIVVVSGKDFLLKNSTFSDEVVLVKDSSVS